MSSTTCINLNSKSDMHRNVADFEPSVWGDYFLQYVSESMEFDENLVAQIETLKNDVRSMLVLKTEKPLTKVHLIDSISRLGVSNHFEQEIDEVLENIHNIYVENGVIIAFEDNLCSLAVLFRLLRQQGHHVSPNVFTKFKDEQGNFSKGILNDVEGMLSLYEATHMMIHGEDILEEALAFTTTHLESIANHQLTHFDLAIQIKHSLRQALHKNLPRLEARSYISIYEQDPLHNENLLILAKLDFNILQRLHQKEFGNLSKWWKDLDVPNKLPYVRNRLVECGFWVLGTYFEARYSQARKIFAKLYILATIIDDTYDSYGTIDELELFMKAIERWDISCMDSLPDYMKFIYKITLDLYKEIEEEMIKEERVYALKYYVKEFKIFVQAYMTEARWLNNNYKPTLEEYLQVSMESFGYELGITACYIGMGEKATEDIFKWVSNKPKIIKAISIVGRLMDDIVSREFEHDRKHVSSFVELYMKQSNVSREAAIEEGRKRIGDAWKDINEECLRPTKVPIHFVKRIINFSRFMDVIYKDKDNFTYSDGDMKTYIKDVIIDPIPI